MYNCWSMLCLIFLSSAIFVLGQNVPSSPCPSVFRYMAEPNGLIYGRISVPYDGSSNLQLGVNASMQGYYTDNNRVKLKIKFLSSGQELIDGRAKTLNYDVIFPFQNAIPKITRIMYNNIVYCSGPPEELIPGSPGVTSLWSGHNFFFQTPNQGSFPSMTGFLGPSNQNPPTMEIVQPFIPNQRNPDFNNIASPPSPSPPPPLPPKHQKVECGISKTAIVPLILGGQEINDGMFPWLAAMFTATSNGYEYKCTANLISDKHVVTAARCVNYFKIQLVELEDILFVFGKSKLKNWATSGAVTRGASAIHTHPEFDVNSGHGDITVITLDRPVELSSFIAPICLWEGNDNIDSIVNKKGTVAGWGADEGERDGSGTCIGDSGAGFMMKRHDRYYLRGLASLVLSEKGKCDLSNYMVFCDAAKLTDWIQTAMKS